VRRYLFFISFALILGGSIFAVIFQRELFPISPYPMYASPAQARTNYTYYEVHGITKDGQRMLFPNREYRIFWYSQALNEAVWRNLSHKKHPQSLMDSLFATYESRRESRKISNGFRDSDREFVALRLYRFELDWQIYKHQKLTRTLTALPILREEIIAEAKK
jgi:hypothetical protein